MSWIAGVFELLGIWLIGNKNRFGFLLNLIGCALWIVIAINVPAARGILLVAIPALFINVVNFIKWGKEDGKTR